MKFRYKRCSIFFIISVVSVPFSVPCGAQLTSPTDAGPKWTRIISASAQQSGSYIMFQMETASDIPILPNDSTSFEFDLRPSMHDTAGLGPQLPTKQIVQFDLTHWDSSPWFNVNTYMYYGTSVTPRDTSRMFDWKLLKNKFWVRFSLDGSAWSAISWKARVFYHDEYVSESPDSGFAFFQIHRDSLVGLESKGGKYSAFIFPSSFDSLFVKYSVASIADEAYRTEKELTHILPVCGDSVEYVFNPYYGGAAIEGSPIYLGPAMWGKHPLWFVYFHELGHDFCNASARFRQLYPLTVGLPPGPLPFNILFYEGWASLPAMYVYDFFMSDSVPSNIPKCVVDDIRQDWLKIQTRFVNQWDSYRSNPHLQAINPDIVDGLFLQLRDQYGWQFFRKFYDLMRPQDKALSILNERAPGDSSDLRITRSTLTAAIFSVLAGKDLRQDFLRWDFPIYDELFERSYAEIQKYLQTGKEQEIK